MKYEGTLRHHCNISIINNVQKILLLYRVRSVKISFKILYCTASESLGDYV
jgi:hypothetical protein